MNISDNTLKKMRDLTGQLQTFNDKVDLKAMVDRGETIYAVVISGARRGSIGKLQGLAYRNTGGDIRFNYPGTIVVEGRGEIVVGSGSLSWIKGYNGPDHWKFTRSEKPAAKVLLDKAGAELNVGDTVVVARDDDLIVGRLKRRTDKGAVFITPILMRERETKRGEVQINSVRPDTILKLSNEMLDQVMLAKLAN